MDKHISETELRMAVKAGLGEQTITNPNEDKSIKTFDSKVSSDAVKALFVEKLELLHRAPFLKGSFRPPFSYNATGQYIFDADGQMILDVRGWGHIQYLDHPIDRQDSIGLFIVDLLNLFYPR